VSEPKERVAKAICRTKHKTTSGTHAICNNEAQAAMNEIADWLEKEGSFGTFTQNAIKQLRNDNS